jgi:hypothetical protein
MNGFILGYFLIIHIRVFNRTVFRAGGATCAFVFDNVSGLLGQGYLEIPCFAL